jgi:hypothetical protein
MCRVATGMFGVDLVAALQETDEGLWFHSLQTAFVSTMRSERLRG